MCGRSGYGTKVSITNLNIMLKMYYAITFDTNNILKITLTPSEDSGQPGQMRSLIRVSGEKKSTISFPKVTFDFNGNPANWALHAAITDSIICCVLQFSHENPYSH